MNELWALEHGFLSGQVPIACSAATSGRRAGCSPSLMGWTEASTAYSKVILVKYKNTPTAPNQTNISEGKVKSKYYSAILYRDEIRSLGKVLLSSVEL